MIKPEWHWMETGISSKGSKTYAYIISIVFALLLLTKPIFGQTTIETDLFTVEYSEELEQPLKLDYIVQCPFGDASRSGLDFEEPDNIHTSDDDDYYDNVWDKGHLAPVNSFNCSRDDIRKTFTYLNSALQHQSLNRGVWRKLEEFENSLALFYEVSVTVEVLFDDNSEVLPTGATVPTGFIKILRWDDQTAVWHFPNENTSGTDWEDYLNK